VKKRDQIRRLPNPQRQQSFESYQSADRTPELRVIRRGFVEKEAQTSIVDA
jgi:hypothetical protein